MQEEEAFDAEEQRVLVSRYEEMLESKTSYFFDLDDYESIIQHYMQANELEEARKACELAMESYPYSTNLLLDYAHLLVDSGDLVRAKEIVAKAEHYYPFEIDLIMLKSSILSQEAEFDQLITYLEEMQHHVEEKDRLFYVLGNGYFQKGMLKEAVECYKQAIKLDATNEDALNDLLYCYELAGNLETCLEVYDELIEADPFNFKAWLNKGVTFNKLKQYDKAIEAIELSLAINEKQFLGYFHLGSVYMNMAEYDKAIEEYKKALELDKTIPECWVCLGAAFEEKNSFDQAIYYYRQALKLDPEYDDAHYGVGACLLGFEKYSEALFFFNKAIKLNPENDAFWHGKAQAEFELGNVVSALEAYEKVYELDSYNVDLWLDWSYIYYEQGDIDQALSIVNTGIDEMPTEAELLYRATAYLIGANRYKEALAILENALLLDFELHTELLEFFDDLDTQKALYKLIAQYKK